VIPGPPFPDTLASSTTDITLSGRLTDVAVGGGGRYLVLYLESQNKLALFDVKEKKVTTELPAPNGKFHFAANATHLVTIAPTSNTLETWNLATGKKESSSALPEVLANKEIHQVCMGSASQRRMFLYLPREKLTAILDLPTLRVGAVEWARWGPQTASGPLTMRASPDASLLVGCGGGWGGAAVAGFQDGRQVSLWENTEGTEHLFALPSTNNKYIFTELGMSTSDFRTKKIKELKNSYLVPAHEPGLFLSLHYLPGPGIQRDPGGRILFQPIKKVVLRTEDGQALFGLDDKEWDVASDLPWEKIIHYYPATRMMITFPDRNKVRLRQF
jgi:hypothetical protein